uniref:Uncharacterized protein n=1 Tax=Timema shepardi TaxID=629360 RepID=A0A7R9AZD2_TIMSH|nr:unnamed protein product [Timema shepardi]
MAGVRSQVIPTEHLPPFARIVQTFGDKGRHVVTFGLVWEQDLPRLKIGLRVKEAVLACLDLLHDLKPCMDSCSSESTSELDDMEMMLNKIVPEPAHVKACFLGSSLTIPITDGKLNLGTWQGIWLCEHRDHAGSRKVVITINGCLRDSSRSPMSPVSPMASTSS